MTPTYTFVRVNKDTHRKLRILAANMEMTIIDLIDRLVTEETQRNLHTQENTNDETYNLR
jgi:hypothetical protein